MVQNIPSSASFDEQFCFIVSTDFSSRKPNSYVLSFLVEISPMEESDFEESKPSSMTSFESIMSKTPSKISSIRS